jgi:two-component system, LytTR family, response regulator LytT
MVDLSLEELEDQLDPASFFRLNRQFIVSISAIAKVYNYGSRKLKVEVAPAIPEGILIRREKSSEFKRWLDQ